MTYAIGAEINGHLLIILYILNEWWPGPWDLPLHSISKVISKESIEIKRTIDQILTLKIHNIFKKGEDGRS